MNRIREVKDSAEANRFCVLADAFSVEIDAARWPVLMKKLDINEEIPPGYPALEVRCYDFSDNLRPDLYSKTVEFKAQGVGRGEVITKVRFDRKNQDLTMYNIRFLYAVKIDKPLYYRITEISDNALPEKSEWKEVKSWNALIDVTSRLKKSKPESHRKMKMLNNEIKQNKIRS